MRPSRIAILLLLSFLLGGSSAEVAVQAQRAVTRHHSARETGSVGHLVALELWDDAGALIARPRLISPPGRPAELILRDPADPARVRLELHVEAIPEPCGDVSLAYRVSIPGRDLAQSGKVSIAPGIEQTVDLADGNVTAIFLTLPIPSTSFDAYLESQGLRRNIPDAI